MSTGDILSTVFKHKICEINEKDESVSMAADTAAIHQVGVATLRKSFWEASAASDRRAGMRKLPENTHAKSAKFAKF